MDALIRINWQSIKNSHIGGGIRQSGHDPRSRERGRWRRLRRVEDVNPYDLGLHLSGLPADADHIAPDQAQALTPYVRRDLHHLLRDSISRGGLHVIVGDSATGKTRLGYEAVKEAVPRWRMLRPANRDDLDKFPFRKLRKTVIWLENMEEFVGANRLTASALEELSSRKVTVIGTLRVKAREELLSAAASASGGSIAAVREILRLGSIWATGHNNVLGLTFSPNEIDRAQEVCPHDGRIREALNSRHENRVCQFLAGALSAVNQWKLAESGEDRQISAAIIRAAVDFRRAGCLRNIPRDALLSTYSRYLPDGDTESADKFQEGLEWSSRSDDSLEPPLRKIGSEKYRAFDALVDYAQVAHPGHKPINSQVWERALELSQGDPIQTIQIGSNAANYWEYDMAIRAFRQADEMDHFGAAYRLGVLLCGSGRREEGIGFLEKDFKKKHWGAMVELIRIYDSEGQTDKSKHILDEGQTLGIALATCLGASRLKGSATPEEVSETWRRGLRELKADADSGSAEAAFYMGNFLRGDDAKEAERYYRVAISLGHDAAPVVLADFLENRHDIEGAIDVYRQAMDAGDFDAGMNLGYLLSNIGRTEEAISVWRLCTQGGDLGVNGNLGVILMDEGREREAVDAWRKAANAGYPGAAYFLGCHLRESGEIGEAMRMLEIAKEGFQREIKFGDYRNLEFSNRDSWYFYGLTCRERGETSEAIEAFQKAKKLGHQAASTAMMEIGQAGE